MIMSFYKSVIFLFVFLFMSIHSYGSTCRLLEKSENISEEICYIQKGVFDTCKICEEAKTKAQDKINQAIDEWSCQFDEEEGSFHVLEGFLPCFDQSIPETVDKPEVES